MTAWTGGLPPAAHRRIAHQQASGVAGSLLTSPGAAAARTVDLQPVGEVFGSVVMQLGWAGGGCGIWNTGYRSQPGWTPLQNGGGTAVLGGFGGNGYGPGGFGPGGNGYGTGGFGPGGFGIGGGFQAWTTPVLTTGGQGGGRAVFGSYVHAWAHAWHTAHDRMVAEAAALGADGVVGVRIRRSRLEEQSWEYTAIGTAVRSLDTSKTPSARNGGVWTAGFAAEEVAALVQSGYVPRGMALGLSVSTKHEDALLKAQRSMWSDNTEIDGLTELLEAARSDARTQMIRRAVGLNGSDIVISDSFVGEFETPCNEEVDLHAEAMFVGTVIAPGPMHAFRNHSDTAKAARDILNVLPLTDTPTKDNR